MRGRRHLVLLVTLLAAVTAACGGQAEIAGDGWTITPSDVDELIAFVEHAHQLEFASGVEVLVTDLGSPDTEVFNEEDWALMTALGLVGDAADRSTANRFAGESRMGGCCRPTGGLAVGIEVQPDRLFTEALIVHELAHALQREHFGEWDSSYVGHGPSPRTGAHEGAAQYVALEYIAAAPDAERAAFDDALQEREKKRIAVIGAGANALLDWGYDIGPAFVGYLVEQAGAAALTDLRNNLPVTTKQVLFPNVYLAGEQPTAVASPAAPQGSTVVSEGTLGAAMLLYTLEGDLGRHAARALVADWVGDSFVLHEHEGRLCINAHIVMETDAAADDLADAIEQILTSNGKAVLAAIAGARVELQACG